MTKLLNYSALILLMVASSSALGESFVFETGQTSCYDSDGFEIICNGTLQDGDLRAGIEWPVPRFTDRGNGTVTDHLTNLTWVQNLRCYPTRDWQDALNFANTLSDGQCGLLDGSISGDWRLPNIREFISLVDYSENAPALPAGHPFIPANVQTRNYWSSTTRVAEPTGIWKFTLGDGSVTPNGKVTQIDLHVWGVRDAPPPLTQCSDGVDNDGDGRIDLDDKQCRSADQNSEMHPKR